MLNIAIFIFIMFFLVYIVCGMIGFIWKSIHPNDGAYMIGLGVLTTIFFILLVFISYVEFKEACHIY